MCSFLLPWTIICQKLIRFVLGTEFGREWWVWLVAAALLAQGRRTLEIRRVGQNRLYTPYMTIFVVISLQKMLYTHRIYIYIYIYIYISWSTLEIRCWFQQTTQALAFAISHRTEIVTLPWREMFVCTAIPYFSTYKPFSSSYCFSTIASPSLWFTSKGPVSRPLYL